MKKIVTRILVAVTLLALLAGCTGIPELLPIGRIIGSGNVVEQEYETGEFAEVSIGNAFAGEINHGDSWHVVVRADDNILPKVQVREENGVLHIGLEQGVLTSSDVLEVAITMPAIEAISLSGASRIALDDFAHAPAFSVTLAGASELDGSASADTLSISLSGASRATLSGEGDALMLDANGASVANLADLVVATADVTLTGASRADVTASQTIDLVAAGASSFTYGGGATLESSQLSGASTASERE